MSAAPTVAFVASDVGPTRYLLALRPHLDCRLVWCGSELSSPIMTAAKCELSDLQNAIAVADVVVTGTCLGEGIDKMAIRVARSAGVPIVSVVEHWTWFLERFVTERGLDLPDRILVNDEIAKRRAIAAGLPHDLIITVGNPVLEELATEAAEFARVESASHARTIVFVSENLASDQALGRLTGMLFNEHDVLSMLRAHMAPSDTLLIKLHPTDDRLKYSYVGDDVEIIESASPHELAARADLVVGIGSMLLLELAILGCRVINLEAIPRSPFIGALVGATQSVVDLAEMGAELNNPIQAQAGFAGSFVGSGRRAAEAILNLAVT